MRTRALSIVTTLGLALACTTGAPEPPPADTPAFDAWAARFAADWMRLSPLTSTMSQYFSGDEQDALDRQLTMVGNYYLPYGAKASAAVSDLARRGLKELETYARAPLTPTERASAAIIKWSLETAADASSFARHDFIFDQFLGLHLTLVDGLTQSHPVRNRRDVENYLARLALVPSIIDQGIDEARTAAAQGFTPPRIVLQRALGQLDEFLKPPAAENVFVSTLDTRMAALGTAISAADRASFTASAVQTVSASVAPAYRRVRDLLAEQLKTAADDVGVWRLPDGAAFYQHTLHQFTTTRLTPDEIHTIGLREVARIEGEMDRLLRQLGYTTGSVEARTTALNDSLQPRGPGDPRPGLVAAAEKAVRDAETRAALIFDRRPKAPVDVRREPVLSEKTTAAHYNAPAPDGSRPGIFFLPLPGPKYSILGRRTLAHHEAVPGHHFQIALQLEDKNLPYYRSRGVFEGGSAYTEGWALYAERLADENGWFDGDPQSRIGYLNSMLFRARRLVVDTGIHAKHWTRQQAIDYGISPQEVERYIAWPGQACSYMIGQLRLVELREKARSALGSTFSVKDFHNLVLGLGSAPLEVVAQEVDAWIAQSNAR